MTEETRDIGPDNGKRPPFANTGDEHRGGVGTGEGYSGQEYDSVGQAEWRERDDAAKMPKDGVVRGSGSGAGAGNTVEDFDVDTPGGARPNETGRED